MFLPFPVWARGGQAPLRAQTVMLQDRPKLRLTVLDGRKPVVCTVMRPAVGSADDPVHGQHWPGRLAARGDQQRRAADKRAGVGWRRPRPRVQRLVGDVS
jgi:hypothetical protein